MTPSRTLPQRTCLGCRQARAKEELLRLVRTPSGDVAWDPTGRSSGRGAYVCRDGSCWQEGLQKKRLDHALRMKTTPEMVQRLRAGR